MPQKQCDNCSEMVDEAKAFCPGCGNAFVEEEKRQDTSSFEKLGNTVQLGQTMYNQMLSDMGLNISKAPDAAQRSEIIEAVKSVVVEPVVPVEPVAVEPVAVEPVEPIAIEPVVQTPPPVATPESPKPVSNTKWYVLGGLAVIVLLPVALASTIFLFFEILARLR